MVSDFILLDLVLLTVLSRTVVVLIVELFVLVVLQQ